MTNSYSIFSCWLSSMTNDEWRMTNDEMFSRRSASAKAMIKKRREKEESIFRRNWGSEDVKGGENGVKLAQFCRKNAQFVRATGSWWDQVVFDALSTSDSYKRGHKSLPFIANKKNYLFFYQKSAKISASGWLLIANCNMQISLADETFLWVMAEHLCSLARRNESIFLCF